MFLSHIGDLPIDKIHPPETKRKVYRFSLVIPCIFELVSETNDSLVERIATTLSSDMHIVDFPTDFHVSLMEIF